MLSSSFHHAEEDSVSYNGTTDYVPAIVVHDEQNRVSNLMSNLMYKDELSLNMSEFSKLKGKSYDTESKISETVQLSETTPMFFDEDSEMKQATLTNNLPSAIPEFDSVSYNVDNSVFPSSSYNPNDSPFTTSTCTTSSFNPNRLMLNDYNSTISAVSGITDITNKSKSKSDKLDLNEYNTNTMTNVSTSKYPKYTNYPSNNTFTTNYTMSTAASSVPSVSSLKGTLSPRLQPQRNKFIYIYPPPPNKPIPAAPPKKKVINKNQNNNAKNSDNGDRNVKWINFVAKVKGHQTKNYWKTYTYHRQGFQEDTKAILDGLELTDKEQTHGSFTISGNKVFVYIRDLHCNFPYSMVLRTNTNNVNDGIQILQQIVNQTNASIQQLNIHNIETFDYNIHFDNLMNRLMIMPVSTIHSPSSFIVQ